LLNKAGPFWWANVGSIKNEEDASEIIEQLVIYCTLLGLLSHQEQQKFRQPGAGPLKNLNFFFVKPQSKNHDMVKVQSTI
jgi:hypothetical protein